MIIRIINILRLFQSIMIIHDTQVRQGQPTPSMIEKNGDIWSCIVCGKIASDPKTKVANKVSSTRSRSNLSFPGELETAHRDSYQRHTMAVQHLWKSEWVEKWFGPAQGQVPQRSQRGPTGHPPTAPRYLGALRDSDQLDDREAGGGLDLYKMWQICGRRAGKI